MHRQFVLILIALAIGALLTVGTATAAYVANRAGSDFASEILFWPNTVLQALVPAHNMGTPDHPLYEGTPLNFFAFLASFPFAMVIYAAVAYLFVRRQRT
jgi:hypothetical protein